MWWPNFGYLVPHGEENQPTLFFLRLTPSPSGSTWIFSPEPFPPNRIASGETSPDHHRHLYGTKKEGPIINGKRAKGKLSNRKTCETIKAKKMFTI